MSYTNPFSEDVEYTTVKDKTDQINEIFILINCVLLLSAMLSYGFTWKWIILGIILLYVFAFEIPRGFIVDHSIAGEANRAKEIKDSTQTRLVIIMGILILSMVIRAGLKTMAVVTQFKTWLFFIIVFIIFLLWPKGEKTVQQTTTTPKEKEEKKEIEAKQEDSPPWVVIILVAAIIGFFFLYYKNNPVEQVQIQRRMPNRTPSRTPSRTLDQFYRDVDQRIQQSRRKNDPLSALSAFGGQAPPPPRGF